MKKPIATARKTVADYLFEGGIKGRTFRFGEIVYQVEKVRIKNDDVEFHMRYISRSSGIRNEIGICYLAEILEDIEATEEEIRDARTRHR